jgi:glucosamine-6-phosphate deaminase
MNPLRSFAVDSLRACVYPTTADLAAAAAAAAAQALRSALACQPAAAAIVASATSQVAFLDALVAQPGIDWPRVTLFHMDEYLGIAPDHPASFRRFLRERFHHRLPVHAFHYIQGDCLEPLAECNRYAQLLRAQPIDLCCLGIGENGHLAFNDPPVARFDDPDAVKLVQLDAACRQQQVGEGCFPSFDAVPQYALTLTLPALVAAATLLCIVPERRKATAVRNALRGPIAPACPASFLRRQPHCTLFLDADSAGLLA